MAKSKKSVTDTDRAIGKRIRLARERLDVTITDLGYAFGGTRQQVQFWERGDNFPPVADLPRLCALLRIDANHLFGMEAIASESPRELEVARQKLLAAANKARSAMKEEESALLAPKKSPRRRTG